MFSKVKPKPERVPLSFHVSTSSELRTDSIAMNTSLNGFSVHSHDMVKSSMCQARDTLWRESTLAENLAENLGHANALVTRQPGAVWTLARTDWEEGSALRAAQRRSRWRWNSSPGHHCHHCSSKQKPLPFIVHIHIQVFSKYSSLVYVKKEKQPSIETHDYNPSMWMQKESY